MQIQAENDSMIPISSSGGFIGLCGNKKYNAAIYAGVILGTKMRSFENTGFHRFNPKFIA